MIHIKDIHNFIHVPKTAGSSFLQVMKKKCPIIYKGHKRIIEVARDYPSFAFVRKPYDRLVSAYFFLMKGGVGVEAHLTDQKTLQQYKDFKDFVLHIAKDNLIERILHIKPMHYWVCSNDNKVIVDKIFKIEDMDSINIFLQKIGIKQKLNDIKKNVSAHKHYMEYMDAEVIAEINKLYSLDFELFGYEKISLTTAC